MGLVKQFWVKLHTKKRAVIVLHGLDGTGLIGGCGCEMRGKILHFVEM